MARLEGEMFKPKNALEHFITRAFYPFFDPYGVLPLGNNIFASAYNQYVRDFYNAWDYNVIEIYIDTGRLYVDYYNNNAECYDGDYAPLWSPEECIYYTLMDMGMNNIAKRYKKYVGEDRSYRRPWKYYWDVDWRIK